MTAPVAAVALVGPRGAGKTTVGQALARRLHWRFVDGDDLLEQAAGMPAGEYLGRAGEAAFRALEEQVTVPAIAAAARTVLALGGGAVLSGPVRAALRRPGLLVVFLTAPPEVLAARVAGSAGARPALTDLPPLAEAAAVLAARLPLYLEVAAATWDTATASADAVAEALALRVRA